MQKAAMIMLYSGLRRGDLPALQYVKAHIQWMKEHVCNDPAAPVIEHFDSSAGIVHARVEIKKKQEAWQLICQAKGMKLKLLTCRGFSCISSSGSCNQQDYDMSGILEDMIPEKLSESIAESLRNGAK